MQKALNAATHDAEKAEISARIEQQKKLNKTDRTFATKEHYNKFKKNQARSRMATKKGKQETKRARRNRLDQYFVDEDPARRPAKNLVGADATVSSSEITSEEQKGNVLDTSDVKMEKVSRCWLYSLLHSDCKRLAMIDEDRLGW